MKKRVFSLILALIFSIGLLPAAALAEGEDVSISGGVIGGSETGGEGGGIYVPPGSHTEGGGGTYTPPEDTRAEIWCVSNPDSIGRSYDGTTDGGRIPINLTFTDGTNEIEFKEGTDFSAVKTFDSADAGWHTVTVEITLIGNAATKYKLRAGEEKFEIGGNINKAYPDLTVSLSRATCAVGEKLLPLLSVEGAPEDAEVTYYYLASALKSWAGSSDVEGGEAMPKIDENTAISEPGTYYVYAKSGETKNYEEERSETVELTVSNDVASVTTSSGVTNNYTSLDDALNAAQDGDTVTLLGDAEVTKWHSLSKAFTLELNGKTATTQSKAELYLHARVIVQDSSTGKTGGMAGTALLNVQEGGDLIIKSGTFNGRIAINVGKLTIEGGTFNQEVDLRRGDSDSVFFSGGTFAKIWYPNSSGSFLDLLADGCAFYYNDGKLVNVAEITGMNLYNVHIGTHAHSFTNGACACGYTCPHTSVDESGACTVCGKQFAASITEGNDVTYYDRFNDALVYAYKNDGCTLKLLADVTGAAVMINNPFFFDLNGHNVDALSVDARATIKDSGTEKGKIGKVTVSNNKVTDLTLGDLLEAGYAFQYENGSWANDSHLRTSDGLKVTVEKAPIQSVAVYAKDKNNKEVSTIAYGTTGEVTLVASCKLSETSGADLSYLWYKLEGLAATAPLEGATGANYTLPDNLTAGTHTYLLICTSDGYSKSAEITITVTKIDLANAEVTISPWPTDRTVRYDPFYPEQSVFNIYANTITVKANGTEYTLSNDDYTYEGATATQVGKHTLTITATESCENYTGSKTFDWEVTPCQLYKPSYLGNQKYTKIYDGTTTLPESYQYYAYFYYMGDTEREVNWTADKDKSNYEVTAAEFVSPDAGENKPINQTITLKNENFVFATTEMINLKGITTTDKTMTYTNFTIKEAYGRDNTTFNIEKAAMPDVDNAVTLTVINDHADTYTVDLDALLPNLESPKTYGEIGYSRPAVWMMDSGYYTGGAGNAKVENGKLILNINKNPVTTTGSIGTVTVNVSSTNYQDFPLTVNVNAANKSVSYSGDSNPTVKSETTTNPDGSVTKTEIKADGTVIGTTTEKDGSVTKTETKADGSSVTENKAADGSTGTVKTDKNGKTEASVNVSSKAVEEAKTTGNAVQIPAQVAASRDSSTAPTMEIHLPTNAGETKVEIPVSNVNSGTVAVLVHPDGTEEIVKSSIPTETGIQLTVTGSTTLKIIDNTKPFQDINGHWAENSIDFVGARELFSGTGTNTFSPDVDMSRAMLWTVLARQGNADLSGGSNWYEKSQLWAVDKGISDGTNPQDSISRAQMISMLWRTAGSPDTTGSARFTDVPADAYYTDAVAWAVKNNITSGVGNGKFDPNAACTRAQIATFLHNAYENDIF